MRPILYKDDLAVHIHQYVTKWVKWICNVWCVLLAQSRQRVVLNLSPPNKAPSHPKLNMKHYKSMEFYSILECQAPYINAKPPNWRLPGDGSDPAYCSAEVSEFQKRWSRLTGRDKHGFRFRRCSRGQTFETETLLKLRDRDFIKKPEAQDFKFETENRDLKNVWIMPNVFQKIFKKYHHHFEFQIFSIFWHFRTCFCCSLPADTADKNADLQSFSQAMSLQYSKSQGSRLVTETCSLRDRD